MSSTMLQIYTSTYYPCINMVKSGKKVGSNNDKVYIKDEMHIFKLIVGALDEASIIFKFNIFINDSPSKEWKVLVDYMDD